MTNWKRIFTFFGFASMGTTACAQQTIPLYTNDVSKKATCKVQESIPVTGEIADVVNPTISIFLPKQANAAKAAVIIFPGGGYARLAMEKEGFAVAKKLNDHGVAAFVVKYRMPLADCFVNAAFAPLQDAEQAMQIVRTHAAEWGYDANNIGVMGFSAGGHLAATLLTHYDTSLIPSTVNLRPNWAILGYPVITMSKDLGHTGSRHNLIGKNAPEEQITYFSNELQVKKTTPPCYIFLAEDDQTVNPLNSIHFYEALMGKGIPAELHIYPKGGHGFGLHNNTTKESWFDTAILWMQASGYYQ